MPGSSTQPRRRRRKLLSVLAIALILIGAGWLTLPWTLAPYIRGKLQNEVSQHLHASLEIGSLRYQFPYGVHMTDVRLISSSKNSDLLKCQTIDLALARLPIRKGPLLIERIVLDRPQVLLKRDQHGEIVGKDLPKPRTMHPQDKASLKLSDLFRLRLLKVRSGSVEYDEDGTDAPPMVWRDLDSELRLTPQSAASYNWKFTAGSGSVADVSAEGSFDIDQLLLDLSQLVINAHAAPGSDGGSPLPGQVQALIKEFGIQGDVKLEASAHVPFRDMPAAAGSATLTLSGARASVSDAPLALDAKITATRKPQESAISIVISDVNGRLGDGTVQIARAAGSADPQSKAWQITEIDGSVENLALMLPKFERPLKQINSRFYTRNDQLYFEKTSAQYGMDQISVDGARVPLSDLTSTSRGVLFTDLHLSANFDQPQPLYPSHFGKTLAVLNPVGPVQMTGWIRYIPKKSTFDLNFVSKQVAMAVGPQKIPITNIRLDLQLTRQSLTVRQFEGSVLGGSISAKGEMQFDDPKPWEANVTARNIDVKTVARTVFMSSKKQDDLNGRGDMILTLRGRSNELASLEGNGECQITNCRLWDIPLFDGIASGSKAKHEALTEGDAAAIFSIRDQKIQFSRAALNSSMLGLQGTGTVGFNGQLALEVFAAPLGDWRQHIKNTRIPIVSDIAGELAGGFQAIVNAASSRLLYQFKVSGPASEPRIETVPAPIVTNTGAIVFGKMIQGEERLLDTLKK